MALSNAKRVPIIALMALYLAVHRPLVHVLCSVTKEDSIPQWSEPRTMLESLQYAEAPTCAFSLFVSYWVLPYKTSNHKIRCNRHIICNTCWTPFCKVKTFRIYYFNQKRNYLNYLNFNETSVKERYMEKIWHLYLCGVCVPNDKNVVFEMTWRICFETPAQTL